MSRRTIALAVLLIFLVGCQPARSRPLVAVTPVPTPTPRPIALPADDAPHADLTEWWYNTGHLETPDGKRYGFELVIFQIERQYAPIYYAAHFAITDHQRQEFHHDQRVWTSARVPTTFAIGFDDWRISGDGRVDHLTASMPGYAIDLELLPRKPPALHGQRGVISFGPAGDSYYYSATRLEVAGTLTDHGIQQPVRGLAWKDRQWGNFLTLVGGGWDWFSVQLQDGIDLMLFRLRGPAGGDAPAYGTLVFPDGTTRTLSPDQVRVASLSHWTSPRSGATYPSGWTIDLPARRMQLRLTPVLRDQELDTRASTGQIYWEGEVTISGQDLGEAVTGEGYVELTGYATAAPLERGASRSAGQPGADLKPGMGGDPTQQGA